MEGRRRPSEAHGDRLEGLSEQLARAVEATMPAAAQSRPLAVLAPGQVPPEGMADAFHLHGIEVRCHEDLEQLSAALTQEPAVAVIASVGLVPAACALIDSLSRQTPVLGGVPVVGVGDGRPAGALNALLGGAELYLERLDDLTLVPKVMALVDRPKDDPFRVVVVDDDPATRRYLRLVLEQSGMVVRECADASQVAGLLAEAAPDLMIVDLHMPGQDGLNLTLDLRRQPELAVMPIVFLSGEESEEARFQAIRVGGDDYLPKPVRPRDLIATVRSRIQRARQIRRQLPGDGSVVLRGGRLRRGDFLVQLAEAMRHPSGAWQVLLAVRVDQSEALSRDLGLSATYDLESAISQRIAAALRPEDAYTLWLEYGFGALVKRDSRDEIVELAKALCRAIAGKPFPVQGQEHALTVSVGVALRPSGENPDPDRWFASAYAAQAIAHRLGGNRHDGVLSHEHGEVPAERVLIIREWVKEAVHGHNIVVEYQPMLALHGEHDGMYALDAKLRDFRAPLSGVPRREYLALAREAGAVVMIDRVGLFNAFEAVADQRAKGLHTRILVPMDLASLGNAQLAWLSSELNRKRAIASGLVIEFEAAMLAQKPALLVVLQRLKRVGVGICLADDSSGLTRLEDYLARPVDMLRVPFAAVDGVSAELFADLTRSWRSSGRSLIVDGVPSTDCVSQLWALGIEYLQGRVLAASSPRLDYDFTQFG
jgi:DNA-binding response OmpR family regulator/EAL domain-containing protein (putative c-di-GMP-specific phosphodiesterase class I)